MKQIQDSPLLHCGSMDVQLTLYHLLKRPLFPNWSKCAFVINKMIVYFLSLFLNTQLCSICLFIFRLVSYSLKYCSFVSLVSYSENLQLVLQCCLSYSRSFVFPYILEWAHLYFSLLWYIQNLLGFNCDYFESLDKFRKNWHPKYIESSNP
jgi:hypothetical protein